MLAVAGLLSQECLRVDVAPTIMILAYNTLSKGLQIVQWMFFGSGCSAVAAAAVSLLLLLPQASIMQAQSVYRQDGAWAVRGETKPQKKKTERRLLKGLPLVVSV